MAALLVGGVAMAATPDYTGVRNDLRVTGTTEKFEKVRQQLPKGKLAETGEGAMTRSWEYLNNTYEATFQLSDGLLCEMLSFDDGQGNIVYPTFEQMPYYLVNVTLSRTKGENPLPNAIFYFFLCWPSQYIYSQVFDKSLQDANGNIPEDVRNYDPVSFEELFNNPQYCRRFVEATGVGTGPMVNGMYSYFTMLPNVTLHVSSLVEDAQGKLTQVYTYISSKGDMSSEMNFLQFSPDDNWTQLYSTIYYSEDGSDNGIRTLRYGRANEPYDGTSDVQGFFNQVYQMPDFGDLHIFNTGTMSSESLGDNNPFPADFPEVTALYYTIGDKYLTWGFTPTSNGGNCAFDRDAFVSMGLELPAGEKLRDHANYVDGYFFADPKYGKDITLDLDPTTFVMQPVIVEDDEDSEIWYAVSAPAVNSMVQYNINDMNGSMESWSEDYGSSFSYRNLPEGAGEGSFIGWGYTDGIIVNMDNGFLTKYLAYSKGKVYYHYNPAKMSDVRELESVGGLDGVETVASEEGVRVNAANGVISVVSAQDAEVAVYGLDGVCIKAVKAAAGEGVNVEAAKGIYVVKAGDKAVKVAL